MQIETLVELSAEEQRWADLIGAERAATAARRGYRDRVQPATEELRLRYDATGAGAELAVRRFLGLNIVGAMMDYEYGRADLRLHAKLLDVKATEYPGGMLQRHRKSSSQADAYVLVIRQDRRYLIVGWATAEELMRNENIGNGRWESSYIMPQGRLRCITTIRSWARISAATPTCVDCGDLGKRASRSPAAGDAGAGGLRGGGISEASDPSKEVRHVR